MSADTKIRVSSAEFIRHFGNWRRTSSIDPLFVTHHGQDTHVLLTISSFELMQSRIRGSAETSLSEFSVTELSNWIHQALIVCDSQNIVRVANRVAHAMCQKSDGELIGKEIWTALPELENSVAQSYVRRAAASGEPFSADLPSAFRKNEWIRIDVIPLANGTAVLFRDITQDVHTHRMGDAKQAIIAAMNLHGKIGYIRLSARGRIERVDEPICEMLKLPNDRLQGLAVSDLVPIGQRVVFREQLESVLRGAGASVIDTEFLANDGSVIPLHGAITEVRGAYGAEGAVIIATQS